MVEEEVANQQEGDEEELENGFVFLLVFGVDHFAEFFLDSHGGAGLVKDAGGIFHGYGREVGGVVFAEERGRGRYSQGTGTHVTLILSFSRSIIQNLIHILLINHGLGEIFFHVKMAATNKFQNIMIRDKWKLKYKIKILPDLRHDYWSLWLTKRMVWR